MPLDLSWLGSLLGLVGQGGQNNANQAAANAASGNAQHMGDVERDQALKWLQRYFGQNQGGPVNRWQGIQGPQQGQMPNTQMPNQQGQSQGIANMERSMLQQPPMGMQGPNQGPQTGAPQQGGQGIQQIMQMLQRQGGGGPPGPPRVTGPVSAPPRPMG
jgi:hypothetical protein